MTTRRARENLRGLFSPRSIAIVGATESGSLYGEGILSQLRKHGYEGRIFPVNPRYAEVKGLKCFARIRDIPEAVDMAIVVIGRNRVTEVITECAQKGVKAATIITAGFAEADDEGKRLQAEINKIAGKAGVRILGPNCAGFANMNDRVVATISQDRPLKPGNVGLVSQSGALMMSLGNVFRDKDVGLSYLISVGNESDVDIADCIEFLLEDGQTQVVAAFVEGFRDVNRLSELASRALEKGKPIIVLKVGRSKEGERAALSHTGSITGSDAVCSAALKQMGIIRVQDVSELVEFSQFFSHSRLPAGDGVAIVSSSGGLASLTADICGDMGLRLPELAGETLQRLMKVEELLTFEGLINPVDVRGQGIQVLGKVLSPFIDDKEFSALLLCLALPAVGPLGKKIANNLAEIAKTTQKPILVTWVGRKEPDAEASADKNGLRILAEEGIPVFEEPSRCVRALEAMVHYVSFRQQGRPREVANRAQVFDRSALQEIPASPTGIVSGQGSRRLLSAYQIPMARGGLAKNLDEAERIAAEVGYPLVVKVESVDIPHKSDAGLVRFPVRDSAELTASYQRLIEKARNHFPGARVAGLLLQEFIPEGVEVILGVSRDPQFGLVIMFGMGGIFVEALKEFSLRVVPLSRRDALELVEEPKGCQILRGFRGRAPADREALVKAILALSQLCTDLAEDIREVDINPLFVLEQGKGVKAVDTLVVLEHQGGI